MAAAYLSRASTTAAMLLAAAVDCRQEYMHIHEHTHADHHKRKYKPTGQPFRPFSATRMHKTKLEVNGKPVGECLTCMYPRTHRWTDNPKT